MRALAAARDELDPVLRERRRRVVALLDDPRCTSCASVLGRAQSLELGADYGKVLGHGAGHPPTPLLRQRRDSWLLLPFQGAVGGEGSEGAGWAAPK